MVKCLKGRKQRFTDTSLRVSAKQRESRDASDVTTAALDELNVNSEDVIAQKEKFA